MLNYEQKYKAVLKTATQWIKDGCTDKEKICLECVFSELRESEEERVLRTLYYLVKDHDWLNGASKDEALAWLEKQKDVNCLACDQHLKGYLAGRKATEEEKQKEQKPAEIIKPEKDGWYICIKDFYAGGKKCASVGDLVQAKAGMYMMGREDISKWFRKAYYDELNPFDGAIYHNQYVKRQDYSELTDIEKAIHRGFLCAGVENVPVTIIKETAQDCLAQIKPAEWSEEDKYAEGYMDGWKNRGITIPAWSEEDEKMLQSIIKDFRAGKVSTIGQEQWLKSLKNRGNSLKSNTNYPKVREYTASTDYTGVFATEEAYNKGYNDGIAANLADLEKEWKHGYNFAKKEMWKPSEEQMSALLAVFNDPNNIGSQTCQLALTGLYEDLKKLMKEE